MADIRKDFARTAEDLSRVGKDAAYVAIGLGVVGFQKVQVARRELLEQVEQQWKESDVRELRSHLAQAFKELDKALGELIERTDASLEPVAERLPAQARAALKQAQGARDQFRKTLAEQLAA